MRSSLKTGALAAAIGVGAMLAASAVPTTTAAADTPASFSGVAKDLLPAVVNISTRKSVEGQGGNPMEQLPPNHPLREFFERFGGDGKQAPRQRRSLGSGFIIDSEGFVVSNHHVIRDADQVTVLLQDDTKLPAEVVGTDPKTDLALLKVDADRDLPALDWGNSRAAEVGDWTLAIGNPFGLGGSVTAGIVSARGRDINAGPYSRFIQTDTAINRGNSGGPLFNADGEVIGVNTAILSPSGGNVGVGFALPQRVAEPIIAELRADGAVTRGWLGVQVQPVKPEIAKGLELPGSEGALIANAVDGGPADKAGLKQGDVVIAFGGEAVEDAGQLAWQAASRDPGERVEVVFWRDGEQMTRTVELGELTDSKRASAGEDEESGTTSLAARTLGVKLVKVTPRVVEKFGLPETTDGAVVAKVAPNGPAASQGLRPGHVIAQIGRKEVDGPADVNGVLEAAIDSGADGVVLLVRQGNRAQFVPVPLATPQRG